MGLGKLTVDVTDAVKLVKTLDKLQRSFNPSGRVAMHNLAKKYKSIVVRNYLQGGGKPLAASTLQKYLQGKRAGTTAPIQPKSPSKPLASLSKLVDIKRAGGKGTSNTSVILRVGVPMSGGALSEVVGMINEFGETHTVVATARVRSYLRALALGVAGTNALVRPVDSKPITITIRIPPRPVWQTAFVEMLARQPQEFVGEFAKGIKRRTGVQIDFRS